MSKLLRYLFINFALKSTLFPPNCTKLHANLIDIYVFLVYYYIHMKNGRDFIPPIDKEKYMAGNNVTKQKQTKPSKLAILYTKLDLAKDERLTRTPIEGGRIGHFFSTFKKNYTDIMLANLLFIVFALPAILAIFYFAPTMIRALNSMLDFNGDMGIGFGGKYDIVSGMVNIYNTYEYMFLILIPCFSIIGLGMAGLYYCSRNWLWGAPVKISKHFFRGIKKRWAEFLLTFTYLGAVVCMMGCSILEYLKADALGTPNAGHWVFMIASAILLLLSAIYITTSLPMSVSFRFKMGSAIKNSLILSIATFPIILITLIVLALPMLFVLNSFMRIILYVALAMIGVAFYVLAVSALAQNMFDSTIIPLYEHDQIRREKEEKKERDRAERQRNSAKKKKKKR